MKKFSIFSTLAALLLVTATGCLKDKGFEAGNYGIQITEIKGVAFPAAAASPLGYGLDVSASPQIVHDLVNVTLEAGSAAETDVNITLQNVTGTAASGAIKTYNDEHGTSVQILPSNLYSVPLNLTIPAGAKFVKADINVTNTTSLNPNLSYGIALRIASASSGYQVAENQRQIIIIFSVKNKYDGRYNLKGKHNRSPYNFPYETEMHMVTAGPSTVYFFWPDVGGYGHPIGIGPGNSMSWYGGAIAPALTFDPATDLASAAFNIPPNPTPIVLAPVTASTNSRYVAATKTIYAYFYYYTAAGQDFSNRGWSDTLTYLGPR